MQLASPASRRYATALLDTVSQRDPRALDRIATELSTFAQLVEANHDLQNVLLNPVFTHQQRDHALSQVMKGTGFTEVTLRFIELLVQRDRVGELQEITRIFREKADERAGRLAAVVESASELTPDAVQRLTKALERSTGRQIQLEVKVDPSLIGGMRTRVGSTVLDGTIRAELKRLQQTLTPVD